MMLLVILNYIPVALVIYTSYRTYKFRNKTFDSISLTDGFYRRLVLLYGVACGILYVMMTTVHMANSTDIQVLYGYISAIFYFTIALTVTKTFWDILDRRFDSELIKLLFITQILFIILDVTLRVLHTTIGFTPWT